MERGRKRKCADEDKGCYVTLDIIISKIYIYIKVNVLGTQHDLVQLYSTEMDEASKYN